MSVATSIGRWIGGEGGIVLVSLSLAVVIVIVVYRKKARSLSHVHLKARMGEGIWDPKESWSSTLTGVGGILGAVLGAEVLPNTTQILSKNAFIILNLGAGALIVIAPLIYNSTRRPDEIDTEVPQSDDGAHVTATQYQGYVWAFLAAITVVLWGFIGQLLTLMLLLWEIPSISYFVWGVFELGALLALIFGIMYIMVSIPWTLKKQVVKLDLHKQQLRHKIVQQGVGPERAPTAASLNPPRPKWSLP